MKAIVLAGDIGVRGYNRSSRHESNPFPWDAALARIDRIMGALESLSSIKEVVVVTSGLFYVDALKWKRDSAYQKPIHIVENKLYLPTHRASELEDLYLGLKVRQYAKDDYLIISTDCDMRFPMNHFILPCLGHKSFGIIGLSAVGDRAKTSVSKVVQTNEHGRVVDVIDGSEKTRSDLVSLGLYYFPQYFLLRIYEYLKVERITDGYLMKFIAWLSKKDLVYGIELNSARGRLHRADCEPGAAL